MATGNDKQTEAPKPRSRLVGWNAVHKAARKIFNVWIWHPEMKWGRAAWAHLRNHGLTRYSDDLERHLVLLRFLSLGGIYRDFCHAAWGEASEKEYECWVDDFALNTATLITIYEQLANGKKPVDFGSPHDWKFIVERQWYTVVDAIQDGFGGEMGLVRSLWNSREQNDFNAEDDEGSERMQALEWVVNGCNPYY